MTTLAAVQMCSTPNVNNNLKAIAYQLGLLRQQCHDDELIAVLPECCLLFGGDELQQLALAKKNQHSQWLTSELAALAQQHQLTLVAGSIPLLVDGKDKFTNSCCVFAPSGELQARYDKIHLFDVDVNADINGTAAPDRNAYQESAYTQAGESCTVTALASNEQVKIGLSICYDLRFPELFRQLRVAGASIITVPSAFTQVTGKAHWQALLQARAIENQVYIIAAGQQGHHENGRETWGHSMIINPWGEIVSCIETGSGFISAAYKPQELMQLRAAMPVASHNQFTVKLTQ